MKRLSSISLLAAGFVLGSLASVAVSGQIPLLQKSSGNAGDPRLVSRRVTLDQSNFAFFIRDTKANACWLELPGQPGEGIALAPAPVEACEIR